MASKKPTAEDRAVGNQIREKREAQHMKQETLADFIGVTRQMIQKYETGRSRITAVCLKKIADALGIPVNVFFPLPRVRCTREDYDIDIPAGAELPVRLKINRLVLIAAARKPAATAERSH